MRITCTSTSLTRRCERETRRGRPLAAFHARNGGGGGPAQIEDELIDDLFGQLRRTAQRSRRRRARRPGGRGCQGRIETGYLQLVLQRVMGPRGVVLGSDSLRRVTLQQLGGAKEIVQAHLDGVMDSFSREERALPSPKRNRGLVTPRRGGRSR